MGITLVQKSDLSKSHRETKKALVLAGGAISGGAFKLGGLVALDRYLKNHKVSNFDIYMGISAGAFIAAPIAAGIDPMEIVEAFIGQPRQISRFRMGDFYNPNWRELWERPAHAIVDLARMAPRSLLHFMKALPHSGPKMAALARDFVFSPSLETAENLVDPILKSIFASDAAQISLLPSGFFDNSPIERYLRTNLERNGLPNSFRRLKLETGKSLYIGATNLNTAQGVVFGHDEDNSVTISEAVQASSAIPGFFKPARLGPPGREQHYVDAAVRKTANISVAVRHGAQLIICYNPFRPFVNYQHRTLALRRNSIADLGLSIIVNQAFRTVLHSRLRLGIEKLRLDESFRGDVVLIEPSETDASFFAMNPLAFWARDVAAELGFQSVRQSLTRHHETLRPIFSAYGIEVDPRAMGDDLRGPTSEPLIMPQHAKHPRLRLVSGGRH